MNKSLAGGLRYFPSSSQDDAAGSPGQVITSTARRPSWCHTCSIADTRCPGRKGTPGATVNVLPKEKQKVVIASLLEGCSLRGAARLADCHQDTARRLMVRTREHCRMLLLERLQGISPRVIECDEVYNWVSPKPDPRIDEDDEPRKTGRQWIWTAIDRDSRLILAHHVGKRNLESAYNFLLGLKETISGKPTIVTDGLILYVDAIEELWGQNVNFAQLIKDFSPIGSSSRQRILSGKVALRDITTSYIERSNLSLRHFVRRLTRKTCGFSRKLRTRARPRAAES